MFAGRASWGQVGKRNKKGFVLLNYSAGWSVGCGASRSGRSARRRHPAPRSTPCRIAGRARRRGSGSRPRRGKCGCAEFSPSTGGVPFILILACMSDRVVRHKYSHPSRQHVHRVAQLQVQFREPVGTEIHAQVPSPSSIATRPTRATAPAGLRRCTLAGSEGVPLRCRSISSSCGRT